MAAAELASLRICERNGCFYRVPEVVKFLEDILVMMSRHLAIVHPGIPNGGAPGGQVPQGGQEARRPGGQEPQGGRTGARVNSAQQ